jgi:hypothetical protein
MKLAYACWRKKRLGFPHFPKTDERLLGTWKSDKRRTFAEWNWKNNTSAKKKARLKAFFGKLEVTYTRANVISLLRHRKWRASTAIRGFRTRRKQCGHSRIRRIENKKPTQVLERRVENDKGVLFAT